jgi:signal transduction histidine kinase
MPYNRDMGKRSETPQTIKPQARILVVDDDQALLQALPRMLTIRLNYVQVDTADAVPPALALIETHNYDAIISDIRMPGMDGFELLDTLQETRPDTPVLLITGHGEHDLAIRALRGGAYDYILKPIDRDHVVSTIQRAIDTAQLRRQVKTQQIALEQYAASLEQQVIQRTQDLQATNAELVTTNHARERMLRMVVHELAGPFTSLNGMIQLLHYQLKQGPMADKVSRSFITVERSLHRLERLVMDLHDASHIQAQQFSIHRLPTDLIDLCQQMINEFTTEALQPTEQQLYHDTIMADVDTHRLSQVIFNLLTNARKYSSPTAPITVLLQKRGAEITIHVQDQGVGIESEALQHIYEQFYRVPGIEVQSGSGSGLGLGLYISHAIVEQHGGRMEVQSTPGQGSTFSVILTAVPGTDETEPEAVDQTVCSSITWQLLPHELEGSYSPPTIV